MYRIAIEADPQRYQHLRNGATRHGWLRKLVARAAPAACAAVFDADRSEGVVEVAALPPALASEVTRLLPWHDGTVRRLPSVAVYALHDGERVWLVLDVRVPAKLDAAAMVARIAVAHLAERAGAIATLSGPNEIRLAATRSLGDLYRVQRLWLDEADPASDETIRISVFAGLVGAALREADPLALLEVLPAMADSGLYLDSLPEPDSLQRYPGKAMYHGLQFSLDADVRGVWQIGGGALFGYGRVEHYRAGSWQEGTAAMGGDFAQ